MRKMKLKMLCVAMGGSFLCSSCLGSFSAWNGLKSCSMLEHKVVNKIAFIAFYIVPVYEIAYLTDVFVLNSIEFWSGINPLVDVGIERVIRGINGEYLVRTNEDGYTIMKMGEADRPLDLVYDEENRTWNAVAEGQAFELMTMNEDGSITYKDQKGEKVTVMPELIKDAVAAR